jgi:hypothetical protein
MPMLRGRVALRCVALPMLTPVLLD